MGGKSDDGGSNQQQQMDTVSAQRRYNEQQALLRQQTQQQATPVETPKLPEQPVVAKQQTPTPQPQALKGPSGGLGDQLISGLAQGQIEMNPGQIAQVPGLKIGGQPPTTAQV